MVSPGPGITIDAPPQTPPPTGLLAAAQVIPVTSWEFVGGVNYQPASIPVVRSFDPCSGSSDINASFTDAATTSGSAIVTSVTAGFNAMDAGRFITGAGIPANATILSVESPTSITLSANATATATGVTLTITNRRIAANRSAKITQQAFGLMAYDTCSTFGFSAQDYEARARQALAAVETMGVEREFALAEKIASNVHLQDTNARVKTLNSGTAMGLRSGLAALVQSIADYKLGKGMIHARPYLVEMWFGLDLLYRDAGKLYTATGNLVVSGAGYPGGPPNQSATATTTAEWAYATDAVQVYAGPVDVFPSQSDSASVNRAGNIETIRAQRFYSIVGNFNAIPAAKFDTTSSS